MKKLSLSVVTSAIITTSLYADSAANIDEAFSKGKISGEISAYTTSTNNSSTTADTGYIKFYKFKL